MDEHRIAKASDLKTDGTQESTAALFDIVVTSHAGMISRIALAYEADPNLRRDLIQDILLAIWVSLPQFRREAKLKTFAASIAYKQSISHVARAVRRSKASPLPADLVCDDPLPDEVAYRAQLRSRMLDVVQMLPLAQRQAIILCLEGFSFREIGEILGISAYAAKMRCHRAKTEMRNAMEKWS